VNVSLKPGRRSSFEVTLDTELIHSKLDTGEWPDTERVLDVIARRLSP
jgi:selT/selW/selH-like putative selenoprotein